MKKFRKKIRGSISLFLSLIMLLLIILEGFLIDGSKVLAAKSMMSSAGEMALNAGLTYYDQVLYDIYGLFAVSETEEELSANLKNHFKKTLGESVGSGGADTQYIDEILEHIDSSIKNGWNGEEAGRLLNLQLDDSTFKAGGVDGSQLSQPYVLRSQILEYMKYRGPASLGYGMLEKIHAFKEVDKQQKTMEKKLDYEEKMSDVQKACENAYENIVPYNQLLDGSLSPSQVEDDSLKINQNMRESIIAAWCYSTVKQDYGFDSNWKKKTSVSGRDVEQAFENFRLYNSIGVSYDAAVSALESDFSHHPYGAMAAVKVILGYKQEYGDYCNFHTTWQNYLTYYKKEKDRLEDEISETDDEDKEEELQDELDELNDEKEKYQGIYDDVEEQLEQFIHALETAQKVLQKDINDRMKIAVTEVKRLLEDAERLEKLADSGKDELENVIKHMGELNTLGSSWQSTISDLSEGDIKTSMQADYDNKSKELDEDKIRDLQEKLENGASYARTIQNALKNTKAVDYVLYDRENSQYHEWLRKSLEGTKYKNDTKADGTGSYDAFSIDFWEKAALESPALSDSTCTVYLVDEGGGTVTGDFMKMNLETFRKGMDSISAKKDPFFQFLERVCPKSEADKTAKKDAQDAKKQLLEKGKSVDTKVDGLPDLSVDVTGSGGNGASGKFDSTDTNANDKTVSKNAKENTKSSGNFLADVGSLLTEGRDKLYLSEYATEMFSYYTIDKMKTSDQVTLSNHPINAANNQMYKAEVEYILWGNPSGNKDVEYTMATIFGIRFLLNSIYAFTGDPEIRNFSLALATSIAGWTGFGVPLVQSVIILALALAETSLDMQQLKEGKSVPIYKSQSNWCIKVSKLITEGGKEIIHNAINATVDAAKTYVFDQLDQLTADTAGEFKNSLQTYTDDTINDVASMASSAVLNPVQERIIGLVNVVDQSASDINATLDRTLDDLESSIGRESDSITRDAKLAAVQYFRSRIKSRLASQLAKYQNSDDGSAQITIEINKFFADCSNEMKAYLKNLVQPEVDKLSGEVTNALNSGNEMIQKETSEALDKMLTRINCGVSFADYSSVNVDGSKGRTSGSAALTMNYKEYVWLFVAVKSMQNEEEMLKRMGNLIQANLASSQAKPSPDFDLTRSYSFIEVNAAADLSTTFFGMPVPVTGQGNVTLGLDKYSIGYSGVLGY
ncbi:hypothetical protein GPL15_07880 [Clostridium sp. MCC353]|uniref:DUF5702 domain-containing protein n=1 Tax=Clostridium sp. MCC353 TaxID=2592646 RepID=UPI001C0271A9|nr:DUF5702 domain-containing protein [Clostridium sp. MCC353]MBT9776421.1 hypothetical protein [Clostridium sp. MCC353]